MCAVEDVFQRVEKKYRLSARQYRHMLDAVRAHLVATEYGASTVQSTYFDTPEFSLIERSLDKPLYKEKLRVRRYVPLGGEPASDKVFVELKKKYKGVVYKRRVEMSDAAATAYLSGEAFERAVRAFPLAASEDGLSPAACQDGLPPRTRQIAAEIDAFAQRHRGLRPTVLISCDREAFAMPPSASETVMGEGELRVTFDARLSYCDLDGDPPSADRGGFLAFGVNALRPLIGEDEVVMEVKSAGPYPSWLVDALSECEAYPSSFSKYGTAYRVRIEARRRARTAACDAQKAPLAAMEVLRRRAWAQRASASCGESEKGDRRAAAGARVSAGRNERTAHYA